MAGATVPVGNMLANPGAEQGAAADDTATTVHPPGWGYISQVTQVHYSAPGFPGTTIAAALDGGSALFAGGPPDFQIGDPNQHAIYQTFDLTAAVAEIAGGSVRATLSGLLGGYLTQGDATTVKAKFNQGDNLLKTLQIGPVTPADRANKTTLLARTDTGLIPAGTTSVEVDVTFDRASGAGTYDDAYADNLSLVLDDETPPVVHTTAADAVTDDAAQLHGTVDDHAIAMGYHFEFGPTTAYGQRTAETPLPAATGAQPVTAALGDLTPATIYHVRLVADGIAGPVGGEDVVVHTTGSPRPLDFTWTPRATVVIAGAPVGGLQFQAIGPPGVTYAWDFDYHAAAGLQPDPSAVGATPRHGFTADAAHDTDLVKGADGERRRVYEVRLRATSPDGTVAEISHNLVVAPNGAPSVDFAMRRTGTGVNTPVAFIPEVSDPDAGLGDGIDHIEWEFDTAPAGAVPGAPGSADLICAPDGSNCHVAATGAVPGGWFAAGANGVAAVNFWARALAAHGLLPLSDVNVDALPLTGPLGLPLTTDLAVQQDQGLTAYVAHDPRAAFLYDNATLLQQSSFDLDAGEATGAQLAPGATGRAVTTSQSAQTISRIGAKAFLAKHINPRQVTLTAVDTAGVRTSVTHTVTLTADAPPKLVAQFVNRAPDGSTLSLFRPGQTIKSHASTRTTTSQKLDHPLTTADELAFDASATTDPDGQIQWYVLEIGKTADQAQLCRYRPGPAAGGKGTISLDPGPDGYGPGQAFAGGLPGGTGPGDPAGRVGSLPTKGLNPAGLANVSVRATPPTLGSLLANAPYRHPCGELKKRTVTPGVFDVVPSAAARPVPRVKLISPTLLKPRRNLVFGTTAIVTRNPQDLRFRIPEPGSYSVSVAAYDSSGQGAIQRTDGFDINPADQTCANLTGEQLDFAGRELGFGGLCLDAGGVDAAGRHRLYFSSTHDIDLNGVVLRPDAGSRLFIDTRPCAKGKTCDYPSIFATRSPLPPLDQLTSAQVAALKTHPGGVSVVVDGDPIAAFPQFTQEVARRWIAGRTSTARIHRGPVASVQPGLLATARYKGSPVAHAADPAHPPADGPFIVTFDDVGQTRTSFAIVLPAEFSRSGATTTPTANIVRTGIDEPRSTILTTSTYADIARAGGRARARAHERAREAAINLAGTIDLSGTTLGPVSIEKGNISFDSASKSFAANIDEAHLYIPDPEEASFHLVIADGELKSADGSVGVKIAIGPILLTQLRFSLITDPLTVSGGASFSALTILTGDLDFTVRPSPFLLLLKGSIGIAGLQLGDAYVQYDAGNMNTLTFGGHFGKDFGPVSLEVGVDGGISFDSGDFFVQGDGHACLFICLDVHALISNIALAACGSVDFGFTDIAAGFAYRFHGGLETFTGCDLGPYKPAVFNARSAGARAAPGEGGPITVPAGVQQVALRFTGPPGEATAPKLTVTGPDGSVYTTAAALGDYSFSSPVGSLGDARTTVKAPRALIDQDPVSHVTTFLIVNPPAGDYQVALAAGQPPLVSSEVAVGEHLAADALKASVEPATVGADSVEIGSTKVPVAGSATSAAAHRTIPRKMATELRHLPRIERSRFRGVVLRIPKGLVGKLTLLDIGSGGTNILNTVTLTGSAARVPVVFAPSDAPGTHKLQAFLVNSDGVPRQVALVDTFTSPVLRAPSAPGLHVYRNASGMTVVDVTPGTAGGLADSPAAFDLVASTASGRRIERLVDSGDAKSLGGGRFRVVLGAFSADDTVKVAGRMVFGAKDGRSASATLHGTNP